MKRSQVLSLVEKVRNRHFLALDVLTFCITPLVALFLRYDGTYNINANLSPVIYLTVIFLLIKLIIFGLGGVYRRFWKLASIDELAHLVVVGFIITFLEWFTLGILKTFQPVAFSTFPYSFVLIEAVLSMMSASSFRFSLRLVERAVQRWHLNENGVNTIIIGAGDAGVGLVNEIQKKKRMNICLTGFLDDDTSKVNLRIRGIPVLGTTNDLKEIVKEKSVKKIIVAIPTASGEFMRKINAQCFEVGIEAQTLPSILEIIDGKINISKLRKIHIEDLLRREVFETKNVFLDIQLQNKVILITGAGGSIGSEIVRQVLKFAPKEIILLGHGENSIFLIEQELKDSAIGKDYFGSYQTKVTPVIGDIKDFELLEKVFNKFHPSIVFHAAAHKHVPLMEANPFEAVKNNVFGTKNLVKLSSKYSVAKFVLISSDKAINPTNVMGATKRIAEMLILNEARKSDTSFSAVRFGNVLGSRGSVVNTFQKQIKAGGPITITHPEIKRYFMTIPEAVQLVLEAFSLSLSGEIFVLDMGKPIKIVDLAKDMIRLSGLIEGTDIEIKYTNLRPGEKLFEELFSKGEQFDKTTHEKIMIAKNASISLPEKFDHKMDELKTIVELYSREDLLYYISLIVPEFNHQGLKKTNA